jgi:hypothetical protein
MLHSYTRLRLLLQNSSAELVRNSSAGLLLLRVSSGQLLLLHSGNELVLLMRNSSSDVRLLWEFVKAMYNLPVNK